MIAVAVGFIKANLGPFGADQVISQGQTMVFKYFNWLYWCINLGSLTSLVLLAYIQQNYSFFIGYLIPLIALTLSFFLFVCGMFKQP
jgi:peptide/histidine transporter 3/4